MNKDNPYLTLPVLKSRSEGYTNVVCSLFVALFFLVMTRLGWQEGERLVLPVTVAGAVIALYVGIRWLLLCTRKLCLTPDELQVWQLGRCVKTIPAHALQMACLVMRTEKSGRNNTSRRLRRRLAISCQRFSELAQLQKERMMRRPSEELEATVGSAKAGWEQKFVTRYLVKRMKYRLPIDGVWVDCYPEMVAALRLCYPHLQWEKVSTVSLKKPKLRDDDPYCFMRQKSENLGIAAVIAVAVVVIFGAFGFWGFWASKIQVALLSVGMGISFLAVLLIALGIDKTLVQLSPKGIRMHCGRISRFYPAEKLRTAMVFTRQDYHEGEYQVIVFSTLSAREIASGQEKLMKRCPGGEKRLRQWKRIPGWGIRLVYRYDRKLTTIATLRSRETNYIMHSPQREQTLRALYPQLQWLHATDEFEVII